MIEFNDMPDSGYEISYEILNTQAAQPGWFACYLTNYDQTTKNGSFVSVPVVLWVTVAHATEGTETQEQSVRPFIARTNGMIVDYESFEHPFLCLVRPGDDCDKVVQAVLAQPDTVVVLSEATKAETLPS